MLLLGALAIALIVVGRYTNWLAPVRDFATGLAAPFHWIAEAPGRVADWAEGAVVSRAELEEENDRLKHQLLLLQHRAQLLAAVKAENTKLKELMNARELVDDRVVVTEVIGVSPDPQEHVLVLDKGREDGLVPGTPILDAHGLLGQVIEASAGSSRVLLITDSSHALPVQVQRNNVRAVAEGTGNLYLLQLRHVSNTSDVREGDVLLSSGLGGRFPAGYPVGQVIAIHRDPGQPFADIDIRPRAQMSRSRFVLAVTGKAGDDALEDELNGADGGAP
ncbi:rod shape-determining protein MreC [Biformimicrobium ophioploci]|uniref:Cell shape-determining protein MreC n=2 Tax=Biformimicrobium ophioploci TaxID=3036711 RepID=A0ABQ6LX33_9GAMM|nr:rod shape-determining protein MreC [Microbulbifer sp. NKW57]